MRFLLFAGPDYYPSGGWRDLEGKFDSLDKARGYLALLRADENRYKRPDWWQIVDAESFVLVEEGP